MTISNDAIEAAARALWQNGSSANPCPWDEVSSGLQSRYRFFAAAALSAAAPIIRAEALREAADAIDENQYDDLDPFLADWLRSRADRIEEGSE